MRPARAAPASWACAGSPSASSSPLGRRELDRDDVAVRHHVVTTLQAQRALLARPRVAAGGDQRIPRDDLRTHEPALDVRVDLPCRVPGAQTAAQVPGLGGLAL